MKMKLNLKERVEILGFRKRRCSSPCSPTFSHSREVSLKVKRESWAKKFMGKRGMELT